MSVQPFQPPNAFLDDPVQYEFTAPQIVEEDRHLLGISIGIAAGYLAWRMFVKDKLHKESPRNLKEASETLQKLWDQHQGVWLRLASRPIMQAYSVVPYSAAEHLAIDYATELGKYVHQTSANALLEGFSAQINSGWADSISWFRASEGYGLDTRQMKSYITRLMKEEKRYDAEPIPNNVQKALDRAVLVRADRLGQAESFKAVQVGKNMIWMAMEASGDLPDGTMKKWITAEDERVCPVCGPLDQKVIPLHKKFTSGGQSFYAPTVHPNCRCRLELIKPKDLGTDVVKAFPGDEFNRDRKGRFATNEQRAGLGGEKAEEKTAYNFGGKKKSSYNFGTKKKSAINFGGYEKLDFGGYEKLDFKGKKKAAEELEAVSEMLRMEEEDKKAQSKIKTTGVILVPASTIFKKFPGLNNYGDFYKMLADETALGKVFVLPDVKSFFTSEDEQYNLLEAPGFREAFNYDVEHGLAEIIAFNKQQDEDSGGRAVFSKIAPSEKTHGDVVIRTALADLNKKQLLYLIDDTLEQSETASLFIDPSPHNDSTPQEILQFMEKQDVNDVAEAIFYAIKEETDTGLPPTKRDWNHTLKVIISAHEGGPHYKKRQFRRAGEGDYRTGVPIIFRLANGYQRRDTTTWGKYFVANQSPAPAPKKFFSRTPGAEHVSNVLIVDLVPVGMGEENLDLWDY